MQLGLSVLDDAADVRHMRIRFVVLTLSAARRKLKRPGYHITKQCQKPVILGSAFKLAIQEGWLVFLSFSLSVLRD